MRKLAWAAGAFSAAVFVACFLPLDARALYAAGALLLAGLLCLFFRGNMRLRVLLCACFAALGMLWTYAHHSIFIAPVQELDGLQTTATLRITDYPKIYDDYSVVTARLTADTLPRCTVSLYAYEASVDHLRPGDIVEADVRFRSATERYDEEIWSYTSRGVFLTGSLESTPHIVGRWGGSLLYFPKQLAEMVKAQVRLHFPADAAPLMTALLTGDRTLLYENLLLTITMSEAGLMHIVAVSGMHVAFLVGFVRQFTGRRRRTAAICIPLVLLFIPMAGGSPSVIRAGFMQILLLIAPLLQRESDSPTSLYTVLALLLAINPQSARSTSLQLSFAAIAGILLLTPRIHIALQEWASAKDLTAHKWSAAVVRFISSSLSSTLGALAFSTPIVAATFGYVSLVSPLTNLLCLGVMSLCFSLGFLTCIAGALLPFLGTALGWLLAWGLRYVMLVVQWLGAWRFSAVYTANPLVAVWLILVYIIIILCWFLRGKRGFRPAIPVCASLCLLLAVITVTRLHDNRDALRFTALDVGQGQSLVLQSDDATLMIDCGGPYREDVGCLAANYIESRFRRGVDVLVLTHLHADHANGVAELLLRLPVGLLILPADDADEDGLLPEILSAAAQSGTELMYLDRDSVLQLGSMELTLYAPMGNSSVNERGLIVSGRCDDFDFLVTGDVGAAIERRLLAKTDLNGVELLVVGHHGSRYSTCEELLAQTQPETALISVGGNSYGHPTDEVLRRLAAVGAEVYRTDHSGNITINVPK